jgi:hypothetical protein
VWRRTDRVMAGVVAAIAVGALAVIVIESDRRVPGIVVPEPETVEQSAPSLTPVDIAAIGSTTETPTSPVQQPVQQPSTRRQETTTSRTSAAGPATTPQTTSEQAPVASRFDPSASFRIVNVVNSLVLDSGGRVQPGTAMKLWEPGSPSPNLQFQLIETGGGYYRLVNRANGLAVDGRGAATAGAYVGQRRWDSSPAMQWLPVDAGNGLFTLTNRATGFVLDGGGPGVRFGAQAKQWPADGSRNLLWRIVAV